MGFLDKVKDTAQKGMDAAQKGATEARDKANEMSLKRKLNAAAEDLGHLVYRQRSGEEGLEHDIDRAISEMRGISAELDQLDD